MNRTLHVSMATQPRPMRSAEPDLVSQCIAGSAQAEKAFYERYYPLVLGITSRYALDRQQAIDFLNRTFLTAFTNLKQFRGEGNIQGWIKKICVNECLSQLRIRRNQSYAEIPDHHEESINPAALSSLQVEDLVRLIQRLPPVPRAIFNLTAVEGFSHAEAAERLGIKETNSRYHLRQARLQLQAALTKMNYTR